MNSARSKVIKRGKKETEKGKKRKGKKRKMNSARSKEKAGISGQLKE